MGLYEWLAIGRNEIRLDLTEETSGIVEIWELTLKGSSGAQIVPLRIASRETLIPLPREFTWASSGNELLTTEWIRKLSDTGRSQTVALDL